MDLTKKCKYIYIALFLLFLTMPANAQFTNVTGTVTDVNSIPYSCGTITATLINNNGISPTLNGAVIQGFTSPVKLGCSGDPTTLSTPGAFQMQIADNTLVKCGISVCGAQTQWQFSVNGPQNNLPPLGTGPQTCTATLTISGGSQSITASFNACPALTRVFSTPGVGIPGGSPIQTQVNNGGVFGGTPCETFTNLTTGPQSTNCDVISKGPNPYIDIRAYGGRAVVNVPNTITVTTNGTSTVTTTGISDFAVNDGIVIGAAAGTTAQTTPAAPTVQVIGANGSSTISYECVGVDANWGLTAASAAGSTSTAPAVFGLAATHILTATWVANVVTVTTSTAMPFSSGTFHVMIGDLVSSGNQIGGIQNATLSDSTHLTYSLTGSGTVSGFADSNVMFVNGFQLTQVSETKGSNLIVLTTDTTHNLQQQLPNQRPTKIYIEGINFPGETPSGYANGVFTITSTTSNTITIQTPYIASLTQNAVASSTLTTSRTTPAQMTALVWPEMLVTCPQNADNTPATGGVYYAVYANYGSGFAPIGFTTWKHGALIDYGPAFTQAGFTAPPAMNLPATPPVSAQKQVFEAQITGINGTTLTLDRVVPQSLSGVTGYHSNGIALQTAINAACGNPHFRSSGVVIPDADSTQKVYPFNAPVDIGAGSNTCNSISVKDSGFILMNGTLMNPGGGFVEWKRGDTFNTVNNGSGSQTNWIGVGSPMIGTGSTWYVSGMAFTANSNGQNCVVSTGSEAQFEKDTFQAGNAGYLSAIPFVISGSQFQTRLRDIQFGNAINISTPQPLVCSPSGNCGQVMWWPNPAIEEIAGPGNPPGLIWEGMNYGIDIGFAFNNIYSGSSGRQYLKISGIQTFQLPWQPLITLEGNLQLTYVTAEVNQMDSLNMPIIANVNCGACGQAQLHGSYTGNNNNLTSALSGTPFKHAFELGENSNQFPSTNSNDFYSGPAGLFLTQPLYMNAALVPQPAAYENCNRADGAIGSNWSFMQGSLNCTSNVIQGNSAGVDNTSFWNNFPMTAVGPSQFAEVTVTTISNRTGPAVFMTPGVGGYACTETSNTLALSSINASGVIIANFTTTAITGASGDFIRLEAIRGTNAATTTLNCYYNTRPPSAPTLTTTDNGFPLGFPGITLGSNTARADNWTGGYLPSISQSSAEQNWSQPQHFTQPVTIGTTTNPVAGPLAANTLYVPLRTATESTAPSGAANQYLDFDDSTTHTYSFNTNNQGTSSFTGAWQCTNVTPVTVNANVTTDQSLMSCSVPAGVLNRVGRTLRIWLAGVYSTPAASTTAVVVKAKLGSLTLATWTSTALSGIQATNDQFNVTSLNTTQTAGATAAFEVHGNMTIDLGVGNTVPDSIFADVNTGTVSSVDTTATQTLQITIAFTVASASNTATERQLILETVN